MAAMAACPKCGADIGQWADVTVAFVVPAANASQKTLLHLSLECFKCSSRWIAAVALGEFLKHPIAPATPDDEGLTQTTEISS